MHYLNYTYSMIIAILIFKSKLVFSKSSLKKILENKTKNSFNKNSMFIE
jgi:Co/Zn/Cd efflux system component